MVFSKQILARNTECLRERGNVKGDDTEWLHFTESTSQQLESSVINDSFFCDEVVSETQELHQSQNFNLSDSFSFDQLHNIDGRHTNCELDAEMAPDIIDLFSSSHSDGSDVLQEDALEYVAEARLSHNFRKIIYVGGSSFKRLFN